MRKVRKKQEEGVHGRGAEESRPLGEVAMLEGLDGLIGDIELNRYGLRDAIEQNRRGVRERLLRVLGERR